MSTKRNDWREEWKRLEEEWHKEFPLEIHVCTKRNCMDIIDGVGNAALIQEIATACDVSPNDVYGTVIELAERKFRVECHGCLGCCQLRPRVNIISHMDANHVDITTAPSLASLAHQVRAHFAGTWGPEDFE